MDGFEGIPHMNGGIVRASEKQTTRSGEDDRRESGAGGRSHELLHFLIRPDVEQPASLVLARRHETVSTRVILQANPVRLSMKKELFFPLLPFSFHTLDAIVS